MGEYFFNIYKILIPLTSKTIVEADTKTGILVCKGFLRKILSEVCSSGSNKIILAIMWSENMISARSLVIKWLIKKMDTEKSISV